MAAPQSSPLPVAPQRNEAEADFTQKANAFVSALEPFRQELQQQADFVNDEVDQFDANLTQAVADATQTATDARDTAVSAAASASQDAADAEVFRNESEAAKDAALALVNFAGKWADLTGALNTPATVFHQGAYWRLLNDLADVTASEPANDNADWLFVYSNAELRRKLLDEATLYADFVNGDYRLYEGVGAGVVRGKSFSDLFNFTRSSDATGQGVSTLETVSADVARFVYSPELKKRQGLLIEESRTRLNTISAAPTAPENVTVTATAHTISFYGTGSIALSGVATDTLIGTGSNERVTLTFTPTAGTLTLTPSGTVTDLQLEVGSVATSVIRGEGTQVTRAADNCPRTLAAELNASEGTILVDFATEGLKDSIGAAFLFSIGDRDLQLRLSNGAPVVAKVSGSVTAINFSGLDTLGVKAGKIAVSYKAGSHVSLAVNGVARSKVVNMDAIASSALDISNTGEVGYSIPKKLHRLFKVVPCALSEAELIALTQPETE